MNPESSSSCVGSVVNLCADCDQWQKTSSGTEPIHSMEGWVEVAVRDLIDTVVPHAGAIAWASLLWAAEDPLSFLKYFVRYACQTLKQLRICTVKMADHRSFLTQKRKEGRGDLFSLRY